MPSTDTPLLFSGGFYERSVEITLESSTTRSGPFVPFATTTTSSRPAPGYRPPTFVWATTATIPTWGGSGCTREAFVRALQDDQPLYTFGEGGTECMFAALRDGSGLLAAVRDCRSANSPVVRVTASPVYVGDVVIANQAQADAYACYSVIDGSLTVLDDASGPPIALPSLLEVRGSVDISYRLTPGTADYRPVGLDALAAVGGDLTLRFPDPAASLGADIGLDAITSVGADVALLSSSNNVVIHGVRALTSISGNLTIASSGAGDFYGGDVLSALIAVEGDVEIRDASGTNAWLNQLQRVGGSVTVRNCVFIGNFEVLAEVAGDFEIDNAQFETAGYPHFGALRMVQGTFRARALSRFTDLLVGDRDGMQVGGLELDANPDLSALTPSWIRVEPSGSIAITNNPQITDCAAQAFVDSLGWPGVATIVGNGGC